MKTSSLAVSVSIFLVGLFVSSSILFADNSSTSVTVGNAAPTISSLSFNGGTNVTLTENSFVNATATMTVTDTNGCSTLSSVSAKFYLASTSNSGSNCTYDGSNCYLASTCTATTTGNQCTGGADTSVQYDCGFRIWYTAEATDGSAPIWSSSIWSAAATATDASAGTGMATNTAQTLEVVTLHALDVTSSLAYGTLSPNTDSGATNSTTTVTATGNTAIDSQLSGDLMCTDYNGCQGGVLQPSQQKYSTSPFVYSGGGSALAATSSPATVEMSLAKPTSTTTPVTQDLSWGIGIPAGQTPGAYTGQNTFSAVAD